MNGWRSKPPAWSDTPTWTKKALEQAWNAWGPFQRALYSQLLDLGKKWETKKLQAASFAAIQVRAFPPEMKAWFEQEVPGTTMKDAARSAVLWLLGTWGMSERRAA